MKKNNSSGSSSSCAVHQSTGIIIKDGKTVGKKLLHINHSQSKTIPVESVLRCASSSFKSNRPTLRYGYGSTKIPELRCAALGIFPKLFFLRTIHNIITTTYSTIRFRLHMVSIYPPFCVTVVKQQFVLRNIPQKPCIPDALVGVADDAHATSYI